MIENDKIEIELFQIEKLKEVDQPDLQLPHLQRFYQISIRITLVEN